MRAARASTGSWLLFMHQRVARRFSRKLDFLFTNEKDAPPSFSLLLAPSLSFSLLLTEDWVWGGSIFLSEMMWTDTLLTEKTSRCVVFSWDTRSIPPDGFQELWQSKIFCYKDDIDVSSWSLNRNAELYDLWMNF